MPTKSGVVGLLGCALGIPPGDARLELELDRGLRFGVRTERAGSVLEDYQTIQGFLPTAEGTYRHSGVKTATNLAKLQADPDAEPAAIVSPRRYLQDAAFLVALEAAAGAPAALLQQCAAALRQPRWPVFLGRKSCVPTRPVFEALTELFDGIEDALLRYTAAEGGRRANERRPIEIEDPAGPLNRQDAVRTNRLRLFGYRRARMLDLPPAEPTALPEEE